MIKKKSINQKLLDWLKGRKYVSSWEIVTKGIELGTAQADRRKREFLEKGYLVRLRPEELQGTKWARSTQAIYRVTLN